MDGLLGQCWQQPTIRLLLVLLAWKGPVPAYYPRALRLLTTRRPFLDTGERDHAR